MGRIHSDWLKAYIWHNRHTESPMAFHFWTGVSTLAGAIRRRTWIDMGHFKWVPNFYIVMVAPPGTATKSTSMGIGVRMLRQIPGVFFGPQAVTWQKLTESMSKTLQAVRIGGEVYKMSCITIPISELGTFLRPEDNDMMNILTDLWDGQDTVWRYETRHMGETVIHNPWINIIGCTTPSWMRINYPETMIEGGLTSRTIFIYGDEKRQLIPYPDEKLDLKKYREEEIELVHDLKHIAKLAGPFTIDEKARKFGRQWYIDLQTNRPPEMSIDSYTGYLAREQGHVHKLAMILSLARRDDLIIYEEDLREAVEHLRVVKGDLAKIFNSVGASPVTRQAHKVLVLIRSYGKITNRELWRLCFNVMSAKEYTEAISACAQAGFITVKSIDGDKVLEAKSTESS